MLICDVVSSELCQISKWTEKSDKTINILFQNYVS